MYILSLTRKRVLFLHIHNIAERKLRVQFQNGTIKETIKCNGGSYDVAKYYIDILKENILIYVSESSENLPI